MNQKTTIYLVRHGQSEFNRDGIISGQVNPPLTDEGHRQIHRTKQALRDVNFDEAYSSDLHRAAKTAEIIYGQPIHESRQLKNFRERSFGSIDGKPEALLDEAYEKRQQLNEYDGRRYKHLPDMESEHEVWLRYISELENVAKKHSGQTILIGAHGTVLRILVMNLNDVSYEDFPRKSINNGDYVKLIYENGNFKVDEIVHV